MKEEKDIEPIDKLFRQSLEGYNPAPPASVWKKIRSQLAGKKSGRGMWLFGPGGLSVISAVLLVLSSWIIYKSFFADPEISRQNTSVSAKMHQPDSAKERGTTEIQTTTSSKPVSSADKNSGSPSTGGSKYPAFWQKPSANKPAHQSVALSKKSPNAKTQTSQKFPLEYDNSESPVPFRNNIPNIKSNQNAEIQLAEKDFIFKATDTIDAFIERSAGVTVTSAQDSTKKSEVLPPEGKPGNLATDTHNNPDTPEPLKPEPQNLVALAGIYGNIGQVYLQDRSPNLYYGGMITGGIWNNKWKAGIETGIGYSYSNDQGLYEFEFQRSDTVGYTTYSYFNSFDSSYLFVYKPNIVDTLIYFDTVTKTSYSYLKIPLYFSKQVFRSRKFSLGIKTGPSVEFMIARTETPPEYQLEGSSMLKITNKSYTRLTTSWQWLIAPQLNWDITDKIVFRLEPTAVFYLNNLYDKNNRPSSSPYGISITGGFLWQFR